MRSLVMLAVVVALSVLAPSTLDARGFEPPDPICPRTEVPPLAP
jgi:hypothetical protein